MSSSMMVMVVEDGTMSTALFDEERITKKVSSNSTISSFKTDILKQSTTLAPMKERDASDWREKSTLAVEMTKKE